LFFINQVFLFLNFRSKLSLEQILKNEKVNPLLGLVLGDIEKSKLILDVILEEIETEEDEIFFLDESLQEYLNQTAE
jgi:hypothetical protein